MTRDVTVMGPPKPEYKVFSHGGIGSFNITLNDMVEDGWDVDGNIVIAQNGVHTIYAQRMVRIKK